MCYRRPNGYYGNKDEQNDRQRLGDDSEAAARSSRSQTWVGCHFELADNAEVVVRAKEKQRGGRFDALRGSAEFGMATDELMRLLRGDDECPNAGRGWY
jgi:hypothetical protein